MENIVRSLESYGIAENFIQPIAKIILALILLAFLMVIHYATKKILLMTVVKWMKNNTFKFDDFLIERKVIQRITHIVPGVVAFYLTSFFSGIEQILQKIVMTYIFLMGIFVFDAVLSALNDIYRTFEISKVKPIKGYIQVVKICAYILGGIVIVAYLLNQNPIVILSGIGALTAVLMLIFKDSILGLVAGIQLSANDMVRIGDWIEMPRYGADGDVLDISLNTVKVANFDRTITTIPTYALMSDSFKNWRGMVDAGGRRIKRSILIDTTSIAFCSTEMLENLKKLHLLRPYIEQKLQEIEHYNLEHGFAEHAINGRRLTNIGTFRAYLERYLKNHPKVHQEMTCIVRQLPQGENGIPLEIYVFMNDINWVNYEGFQADMFEHIFAIVPEFGLRLFQKPTGYDLVNFKN